MTLLAKLGFDTTENGPSKIWVTNRGKKRSIFLTHRLPSDSVYIPEVSLQEDTLDAGRTNYFRGRTSRLPRTLMHSLCRAHTRRTKEGADALQQCRMEKSVSEKNQTRTCSRKKRPPSRDGLHFTKISEQLNLNIFNMRKSRMNENRRRMRRARYHRFSINRRPVLLDSSATKLSSQL